MKNEFCISTVISASPQSVFEAWLDSAGHSAFTGSPALIDPVEGGSFTAWDKYISGTTVKIDRYVRIVQNWRTTEFSKTDPDSRVELIFEKQEGETKLTICHSNIPKGRENEYKAGWSDFYFNPMQEYFNSKIGNK
jgi:activator of HSP90 ATPase